MDDSYAEPVDTPNGVVWIRVNAIGALVFGACCTYFLLTFGLDSAVDAGIDAEVMYLSAAVVVALTLLFNAIPAVSPRHMGAYVWAWVQVVVLLLGGFFTLPAFGAFFGLIGKGVPEWFRGESRGGAPPAPALRYGVAGLIGAYWLLASAPVATVDLWLDAALDAFPGPADDLEVDGEAMVVFVDGAGQSEEPVGPPQQLVGYRLDGTQWLLSDETGQPATIVFWASWCSDCDREMAKMAEVDFRPPGKVFAVATDCWTEDDNRDAVLRKYESSGLEWPLICDSLEEGLADDLREIPTFAVIDARGRLRYWEEGEFRERKLQAVVDTLTGRKVER